MSVSQIFAFDLSWLSAGYAVFNYSTAPRLLGSGSYVAADHKGKVTNTSQLERCNKLFHALCDVFQRYHSFNVKRYIVYETPKAFMFGKGRQRRTSNASIMSIAYAEAILWMACLSSYRERDFHLSAIDPNCWHIVLDGLVVPISQYNELDKYLPGLKAVKLKAVMFCKTIYGLIPKTEHEADAICLGTYMADKLRRGHIDNS